MQSVSYFVLVNHWAFIFLSFPSSSSFLLSNRNVFFSSSCEDKGLPSRCLQATLPLMFLGKSLGSSCLALLGSVLNHSNPLFVVFPAGLLATLFRTAILSLLKPRLKNSLRMWPLVGFPCPSECPHPAHMQELDSLGRKKSK